MNNDFNYQLLTDLFLFGRHKCWKCLKPHADCFHHILKRVSNSPLNAAPLNNWECHLYDPDIHTEETRIKYLKMTYEFLIDERYKLKKEDIKFIFSYKEYYSWLKIGDNFS